MIVKNTLNSSKPERKDTKISNEEKLISSLAEQQKLQDQQQAKNLKTSAFIPSKIYNVLDPCNKEFKESLQSFFAVNKKMLDIPVLQDEEQFGSHRINYWEIISLDILTPFMPKNHLLLKGIIKKCKDENQRKTTQGKQEKRGSTIFNISESGEELYSQSMSKQHLISIMSSTLSNCQGNQQNEWDKQQKGQILALCRRNLIQVEEEKRKMKQLREIKQTTDNEYLIKQEQCKQKIEENVIEKYCALSEKCEKGEDLMQELNEIVGDIQETQQTEKGKESEELKEQIRQVDRETEPRMLRRKSCNCAKCGEQTVLEQKYISLMQLTKQKKKQLAIKRKFLQDMYDRKQREIILQKSCSIQIKKKKTQSKRRYLTIVKSNTELIRNKQLQQQSNQQFKENVIMEEQDDQSPGVQNFSLCSSPLKQSSPVLRLRARTQSVVQKKKSIDSTSLSIISLEKIPSEKKIEVQKEQQLEDVVKQFDIAEIMKSKGVVFREKMQFQKKMCNWFYQKHKLEFGRLKMTKNKKKVPQNSQLKIKLQQITEQNNSKMKVKQQKYFSQSATNFRKTYSTQNEFISNFSSKNTRYSSHQSSYGYKDQQMYSKLIQQKQNSLNNIFRPPQKQNDQSLPQQQLNIFPQLNLRAFMKMASDTNLQKLIQRKKQNKFATRLQTPEENYSPLKRFSETIGKLQFCAPNSPIMQSYSHKKQ